MDIEIKEVENIGQKFKQLIQLSSKEKLLEKGKCISKNIYFDNYTLSIQFHPSTGYLYSFLVKGNIKDRLTLVEFLHKNIIFEKRFGFDKKRNKWAEFTEQLFDTEIYRNSNDVANYFYKILTVAVSSEIS